VRSAITLEGIMAVADLTNEDWGEIHKRAWLYPDFKKKLEEDPTAAINEYGDSLKPPKKFTRKVIVRDPPAADEIKPEFLQFVNPFPPSCC